MANQNQVEGYMTAEEAQLENRQASFLASNGKHEQIKRGVVGDWVEVHEYVGPLGVGYTYILYATEQGKDFIKTIHHGPEARPNTNWTEVTQEII